MGDCIIALTAVVRVWQSFSSSFLLVRDDSDARVLTESFPHQRQVLFVATQLGVLVELASVGVAPVGEVVLTTALCLLQATVDYAWRNTDVLVPRTQ